ncbi:MAG TPA: hypothetical protein VH475_09845 [Tepidisphaeraceae bacterium]|jgi:hypothetical protein
MGEHVRCPKCGTLRVSKLRGPDKIDKMASGLLNTLEKLAGGTLHHCCFCRVQFYDRRAMAPRTNLQPIVEEYAEDHDAQEISSRNLPDTASSGA